MKDSTLGTASFLLVLVLLPGLTFAAETFRFSGKGAQASFFSGDGCVFESIFVDVSEFRDFGPPGSPQKGASAFVRLFRENLCTASTLFNAFGSADVSNENFSIANDLSSADLDVEIELLDLDTAVPITLQLVLTWTSNGEIFHGHFHRMERDPTRMAIRNFRGSETFAGVAGTITDGAINLITGADSSASIFSANDGFVLIDR